MNEDEPKFPKLDGGWCDGGGCGASDLCYCEQWLESREAYQREYNLEWDNDWYDCRVWEKSFRQNYAFNSKIYKQQYENQRKEDRYSSIVVGNNNETISILCDKIEMDEELVDELKESLDDLLTEMLYPLVITEYEDYESMIDKARNLLSDSNE